MEKIKGETHSVARQSKGGWEITLGFRGVGNRRISVHWEHELRKLENRVGGTGKKVQHHEQKVPFPPAFEKNKNEGREDKVTPSAPDDREDW